VKSRRKVLHLRKVVMYASLLNKNTLSFGDEIIHKMPKYKRKHLRNDLNKLLILMTWTSYNM
jgi:hypothetical protein